MTRELSVGTSPLPLINRACLGAIAAVTLLMIGIRATPVQSGGGIFATSAPLVAMAILFIIAVTDGQSAEKLVIDKNSFLFFSLSFYITLISLYTAPLLYTVASICVVYGFFSLLSSPTESAPTYTRHTSSKKRAAPVALRTGSPLIGVHRDDGLDGPLLIMLVDRDYTGGIDGIFDGNDTSVSPILLKKPKPLVKEKQCPCSRTVSQSIAKTKTFAKSSPLHDGFRPLLIMLVDHDYTGNVDGVFSEGEVGVSPVTLQKRRTVACHTAQISATPIAEKAPVLPASRVKKKLTPEYADDDAHPLLVMLVDRNYTGGIDGIFDDGDTGVSPVTLTRHTTDIDTSARKKGRIPKRPKLRFTVINRDYTGNEDGILPHKGKHFEA